MSPQGPGTRKNSLKLAVDDPAMLVAASLGFRPWSSFEEYQTFCFEQGVQINESHGRISRTPVSDLNNWLAYSVNLTAGLRTNFSHYGVLADDLDKITDRLLRAYIYANCPCQEVKDIATELFLLILAADKIVKDHADDPKTNEANSDADDDDGSDTLAVEDDGAESDLDDEPPAKRRNTADAEHSEAAASSGVKREPTAESEDERLANYLDYLLDDSAIKVESSDDEAQPEPIGLVWNAPPRTRELRPRASNETGHGEH